MFNHFNPFVQTGKCVTDAILKAVVFSVGFGLRTENKWMIIIDTRKYRGPNRES